MPYPAHITVSQLAHLVGTETAPGIVDVRTDEDYDADWRLIPGSVRHSHVDVMSWAGGLRGRRVVVL